jgi:hypothetical protein
MLQANDSTILGLWLIAVRKRSSVDCQAHPCRVLRDAGPTWWGQGSPACGDNDATTIYPADMIRQISLNVEYFMRGAGN